MSKKAATRQCVGCRESFLKKELVRVIKTPEDMVLLDDTGKKNGRGAYLCRNEKCLNQAIRSKGLERSLKMSIPEEVYESLKKEMNHLANNESR